MNQEYRIMNQELRIKGKNVGAKYFLPVHYNFDLNKIDNSPLEALKGGAYFSPGLSEIKE